MNYFNLHTYKIYFFIKGCNKFEIDYTKNFITILYPSPRLFAQEEKLILPVKKISIFSLNVWAWISFSET
jgi:hypothetical protein